MVKSRPNQQIGYILRSYPRLSQTFILNEILALEKLGAAIQIYALSHPQETIIQPQVAQIKAPVHYLLPSRSARQRVREHALVLLRHPVGYLKSLLYTLTQAVIDQGYTGSPRMVCFQQAVQLANQFSRAPVDHLHAHFAHDPTFIAQLASWMTGIPFSFTTHARDLFQTPLPVLVDRIRDAAFVITCCTNNLKYLLQAAPADPGKFTMIYHGVNLQVFTPADADESPQETPLILSVGRLVEKKGFFDLLQALVLVKERGINYRCLIYGDGPLQSSLARWIEDHQLTGWVTLAGSCNQQQLARIFQQAALFLLTPTVTEDGDRDGIPNVLVEAMAVGLPVISTNVAGIPELVNHELNGLLFAPHDIEAIASGVVDLLDHAEKAQRLGQAARCTVLELFDDNLAANRLKGMFSQPGQTGEAGGFAQAKRFV